MSEEFEELEIGKSVIDADLKFSGRACGPKFGPGRVFKYVDYDRTVAVRWTADLRSGSKKSGYCEWQLEPDALYEMRDVACSWSASTTYYISTYGGVPEELSEEEFEAERARVWPLGKERAIDEAAARRHAEEERMKREAEEAEKWRIQREALAEINAEKAAEIEKNGQKVDDGLPELTGTPKQIAYALSIRAAYAKRKPGDRKLKRATTAKYWIENHRRELYAR